MAKKKVETTEEQVTLDLLLAPLRVTVSANGTDREILERAKKAAIEAIEKNFPQITQYQKVDEGALTQENAKIGMLVETTSGKKDYGIVTAVNTKSINITYTGNRAIQGHASLFKLTKKSFEEVGSFYKPFTMNQTTPDGEFIKSDLLDNYREGFAGYLHNKGEIIPVVIGQSKGSKKFNLYVIGEDSRYTLDEKQMKMFFKATK